ncbi:MAG: hypothetical protein ABI638_06455 [Ignavibacteriota bacterium]
MKASCKLCLKESELEYSHIIPEYFYKMMYDENHRFMEISLESEKLVKFYQKGAREYLLCKDCENKFSKYERYVSQFFYHKELQGIEHDSRSFVFQGLDYTFMKLFQLSILWRAAVTKLKLFSDVKLGPHSEKLRMMLLNENPGNYYEYGCLQFAVIIDKDKLTDGLIMPPALFRVEGYRICRFTFGGVIWIYLISNHNNLFRWKDFFLLENGNLTIFTKFFEDIKYLMDFGKVLVKEEKLKKYIDE